MISTITAITNTHIRRKQVQKCVCVSAWQEWKLSKGQSSCSKSHSGVCISMQYTIVETDSQSDLSLLIQASLTSSEEKSTFFIAMTNESLPQS